MNAMLDLDDVAATSHLAKVELDQLRADLERKNAELKRLRPVLQFYATQMGESSSKDRRIIEQDGGRRARAALGLPP